MYLSLLEAQDLVFKLKNYAKEKNNVDIAVCPSFVYLQAINKILTGSKIKIGSQNMFYKEEGAFTGEVSPKMLRNLNIEMVIIGHSERRQYFNETDENINLKIKAALKHGLIPVFCVGENLNIRENGQAKEWIKKQILSGVKDLTEKEVENLIIAYEPIWAIGTGKICSGKDANEIIQMIRNTLNSEKIRILYGGSIKSDNFSEHINYPDIDGGLVGGSSLKLEEFTKIIDLASLANTLHGLPQSRPV